MGNVIFDESPYKGNRYVRYPNKLKLVYDENFPKQLRCKYVSLIYLFVINGIIYKIGQSSGKEGINSCMHFYMISGQDDPGINRFAINYLIRDELNKGNLVEVYMYYKDIISEPVPTLFGYENAEVAVSAKRMEELSLAQYLASEGEYPKWNYQESNKSYPNEIHEAFVEYKANR